MNTDLKTSNPQRAADERRCTPMTARAQQDPSRHRPTDSTNRVGQANVPTGYIILAHPVDPVGSSVWNHRRSSAAILIRTAAHQCDQLPPARQLLETIHRLLDPGDRRGREHVPGQLAELRTQLRIRKGVVEVATMALARPCTRAAVF